MCADQEAQPDLGELPSFEEIYVRAGQDLAAVPWASLAPNPALVSWLDQQPAPAGDPALIIGSGAWPTSRRVGSGAAKEGGVLPGAGLARDRPATRRAAVTRGLVPHAYGI